MTNAAKQTAELRADRGPDVGLLLAAAAAVALGGFDPFGWDGFGPLRWLLVPALGFWAVARSIDRLPWLILASDTEGGGRLGLWLMVRLWAALLLWGVVATALAHDPLHAWLGTPDRRFGWIVWLLCGALFVVAAGLDNRSRTRIVRGFAVGASAMGLYTLAEWAGLAIDVEFASGRLGGPFGQPAYLGAAATLGLPTAAGLAADTDSPAVWRRVGALGAAGSGLAVLGSQSRAAWLGLVAAVALYVLVNRGHALARFAGAALGVAALVVLVVPALRGRLTSSFGSGGVIDGRIDEWQVGLRAIGRSPLVGYGPEGYRTVFGMHVDDRYVIDWGRQVITDRAHGATVDTALIFGVPGALLYAALLVLAGLAAVRAMRAGSNLVAGVAVAVVAYGLQQQFLFPLSELDPLLWVAAGLLLAGATVQPDAQPSARSIGRPLLKGLAVGLATVVTVAGLLDLAANLALARAVDQTEPTSALEAIETSIALRPDSIRYRFIASRLARQSGDLELAIQRVDQGLNRSPHDPALRGERARLLLDRARSATTEPARSAALVSALSALETLLADDPRNPAHLQRFGIALALAGDFDRATTTLQRAIELAPTDPEPQQNLQEVLRLQADRDNRDDRVDDD